MKHPIALGLAVALAASVEVTAGKSRGQTHPAGRAPSMTCAALQTLRLPDVRITEAAAIPLEEWKTAIRRAHCRTSGVIGREIRFTVLLPDDWNGRFFMGGGGGFVGTIQNQAAASLNLGYATAGTDTGHQASGIQAGWALSDLERQVNYGHLAIHRTTEVAKAILRAYYSAEPQYSYFLGCSNGGRQGLMEAQRYPDDFDGIVAGAPALDFTRIAASFIKNIQATFPGGAAARSTVTSDNLKLLASRILDACDGRDGVADRVMENPLACDFKLAAIPSCAEDRPGPDCLTRDQRAAIERLYAPARNRDGDIYFGQPFGGEADEAGWQNWITGISREVFAATKGQAPSLQWAFGTEFFKYFVFGDPAWDYTRYDLAAWQRDTKIAATFLNADDPDLDAFRASRGKLILWHGWSDAGLNPLSTIDYYRKVNERDAQAGDYVRLFMLPGVLHCAGGPGPDRVNWFAAIADWVERGRAPDRLMAAKMDADGKPVRTRPVCPYPQQAVYTSGNTDEAESFACRAR